MAVFLRGLRLKNYRGIGQERQNISPLGDLNFFIGPNNSGKSTVLGFISRYLSGYKGGRLQTPAGTLENHIGSYGTIETEFALDRQDVVGRALALVKLPPERTSLARDAHARIQEIFKFLADDDVVWCSPAETTDGLTFTKKFEAPEGRAIMPDRDWLGLWQTLRPGVSGGGYEEHWFPDSRQALKSALTMMLPSVGFVPAIRQIGTAGEEFSDFSGRGLISKLAELQSPTYDKLSDKDVFRSINSFLRKVIGVEDATIRIPHDRAHVLVEMNDKTLPLNSLGTGIHEVVMIAAFCTVSKNMIICIEEPELHLHPILQKKLISHIQEHKTNQYFISTHSATFIDTPGASIFSVDNDGVSTSISHVTIRHDKFRVCFDLGYRASDILQTNCVIWVEGPSDRIYINHWINTIDRNLIEGTHYSIMFYGGRLLSHLSADDNVEEFINLLMLNRNSAVVLDSDKSTAEAGLNETKTRIIAEFKAAKCLAWVTDGREVENYVEHDRLQTAVAKAHPVIYDEACAAGKYDHALYFRRKLKDGDKKRETETTIDKVKVARFIVEEPADLSILDLGEKIEELAAFVREANELP